MSKKHYLLLTVLVLVGFMLASTSAEASRKWCHRDPVFRIGGTLVAVDVAVYDDEKNHVKGPVEVTLLVPPGTAAELVSTDEGFNGLGESISIVSSKKLRVSSTGIKIEVQVKVRADIRMRVDVTLTNGSSLPASLYGTTNAIVSVTKVVKPAK